MNVTMLDSTVLNRPRAGGANYIFDVLREEIITLRLEPGFVLERAKLQERFSLSSTPVRDALIRLQEEGLVDIFPQHATRVSLIDVGLARQAQFLRRSVELEIVRMLAGSPEKALIDLLCSLIRQQQAFCEVGEYAAFSRIDLDFHKAMYDAANVTGLWLLVRRQSGHIDRLRHLHLPVAGKMHEIIREHIGIVDAIEAGDPVAAQKALLGHLSRSLAVLESLQAIRPEFFASP